ncbi:Flp pilus assembly protein CpaB [Faecalispora anaeroviscerum]|uniref:Flp pilus assembly protein CpaB n=1 Tax=Faecalispora anaeroviscerum TaxID=2991836 RepID=UPI0024B8EF3F|nr:Flp pilus assembly protein CpaB [Faecalispora anaeroviscerum]
MKKLLKNRYFLSGLSILAALLICLVITPAFNTAAGKQVEIVRVSKTVPEGTKITSDMIQNVKVGGYNLPDNVMKNSEDIVGQYALAKFQPGDYILSTKVSTQSPDAYLSNLDGKKQAVSITIKNFANGLSGKLKSGDIISLYVSEYGDMKQTMYPGELQYVQLLAATTSEGYDSTGEQTEADKKSKSNTDNIPSTLTVLATPEQVLKIVDYEANGSIHAALSYRGSSETAKKFLELEDKFLKENAQ